MEDNNLKFDIILQTGSSQNNLQKVEQAISDVNKQLISAYNNTEKLNKAMNSLDKIASKAGSSPSAKNKAGGYLGNNYVSFAQQNKTLSTFDKKITGVADYMTDFRKGFKSVATEMGHVQTTLKNYDLSIAASKKEFNLLSSRFKTGANNLDLLIGFVKKVTNRFETLNNTMKGKGIKQTNVTGTKSSSGYTSMPTIEPELYNNPYTRRANSPVGQPNGFMPTPKQQQDLDLMIRKQNQTMKQLIDSQNLDLTQLAEKRNRKLEGVSDRTTQDSIDRKYENDLFALKQKQEKDRHKQEQLNTRNLEGIRQKQERQYLQSIEAQKMLSDQMIQEAKEKRALFEREKLSRNKLTKTYENLANQYTKSGQALVKRGDDMLAISGKMSFYVSAPLGFLAKSMLDVALSFEKAKLNLETVSDNKAGVTSTLAGFQKLAGDKGYDYLQLASSYSNLVQVGMNERDAQQAIKGYAKGAIMGENPMALSNAVYQLGQMYNKTAGYGQDLRALKDQIPAVGKALTALYGSVDSEKIAELGKTGRDILLEVASYLERMPERDKDNPVIQMNMLKNQWMQIQASFGKSLIEVLSGPIKSVKQMTDWTRNLTESQRKSFVYITGTVALYPLVIGALGSIIKMLGEAQIQLGRFNNFLAKASLNRNLTNAIKSGNMSVSSLTQEQRDNYFQRGAISQGRNGFYGALGSVFSGRANRLNSNQFAYGPSLPGEIRTDIPEYSRSAVRGVAWSSIKSGVSSGFDKMTGTGLNLIAAAGMEAIKQDLIKLRQAGELNGKSATSMSKIGEGALATVQGAMVGASFGPWGMLAGAVVGLGITLYDMVSGAEKRALEHRKKIEKEQFEKVQDIRMSAQQDRDALGSSSQASVDYIKEMRQKAKLEEIYKTQGKDAAAAYKRELEKTKEEDKRTTALRDSTKALKEFTSITSISQEANRRIAAKENEYAKYRKKYSYEEYLSKDPTYRSKLRAEAENKLGTVKNVGPMMAPVFVPVTEKDIQNQMERMYKNRVTNRNVSEVETKFTYNPSVSLEGRKKIYQDVAKEFSLSADAAKKVVDSMPDWQAFSKLLGEIPAEEAAEQMKKLNEELKQLAEKQYKEAEDKADRQSVLLLKELDLTKKEYQTKLSTQQKYTDATIAEAKRLTQEAEEEEKKRNETFKRQFNRGILDRASLIDIQPQDKKSNDTLDTKFLAKAFSNVVQKEMLDSWTKDMVGGRLYGLQISQTQRMNNFLDKVSAETTKKPNEDSQTWYQRLRGLLIGTRGQVKNYNQRLKSGQMSITPLEADILAQQKNNVDTPLQGAQELGLNKHFKDLLTTMYFTQDQYLKFVAYSTQEITDAFKGASFDNYDKLPISQKQAAKTIVDGIVQDSWFKSTLNTIAKALTKPGWFFDESNVTQYKDADLTKTNAETSGITKAVLAAKPNKTYKKDQCNVFVADVLATPGVNLFEEKTTGSPKGYSMDKNYIKETTLTRLDKTINSIGPVVVRLANSVKDTTGQHYAIVYIDEKKVLRLRETINGKQSSTRSLIDALDGRNMYVTKGIKQVEGSVFSKYTDAGGGEQKGGKFSTYKDPSRIVKGATAADVQALAKIMIAEAGGEDKIGKMAVGSVVINRMLAGGYKSIRDVIYAKNQFSPVQNNPSNPNTPYNKAVKSKQYPTMYELATKMLFEGYANVNEDVKYFKTPAAKYENMGGFKKYDQHGGHEFYGNKSADFASNLNYNDIYGNQNNSSNSNNSAIEKLASATEEQNKLLNLIANGSKDLKQIKDVLNIIYKDTKYQVGV